MEIKFSLLLKSALNLNPRPPWTYLGIILFSIHYLFVEKGSPESALGEAKPSTAKGILCRVEAQQPVRNRDGSLQADTLLERLEELPREWKVACSVNAGPEDRQVLFFPPRRMFVFLITLPNHTLRFYFHTNSGRKVRRLQGTKADAGKRRRGHRNPLSNIVLKKSGLKSYISVCM